MRLTIVAVHIAGTGFNFKSLVYLDLADPGKEEEVRTLLGSAKGMTQAAYAALRKRLAEFGVLSEGKYAKGMSADNPTWPTISFWPK